MIFILSFLSVQKICDVSEIIVPYFKKNCLSGNKKKDFELWLKGVEIIQKNKGMPLTKWKKNDLNSLIEIHKTCCKYKKNPRKSKWLDMAKNIS